MASYNYAQPATAEPALDELMNEPIVQLLMKRDHVKEKDLWPLLRQTGERLDYFLGIHKII